MTRSYGDSRSSARRVTPTRPRPARDPRFTRLGFTCFRLVAIDDPEPGEAPYEQVELISTRNTMGAFMRLR